MLRYRPLTNFVNLNARRVSAVVSRTTTTTTKLISLNNNWKCQKFSTSSVKLNNYDNIDAKDLVVGNTQVEDENLVLQKFATEVGEPLTDLDIDTMYQELLPDTLPKTENPIESKERHLVAQLISILGPPTQSSNPFKLKYLLSQLDSNPSNETLLKQLQLLNSNRKSSSVSLSCFNKLLYLYACGGKVQGCISILEMMDKYDLKYTEKSLSHLMFAYKNKNDLVNVIETYKRLKESNFEPSPQVYNILTTAYIQNNRLEDGFAVYELMKSKNITLEPTIFAVLIEGCIQVNQLDRAWSTFDHMRLNVAQPDLTIFTLMFKLCQKQNNPERAFNLFQELNEIGLVPNTLTLNSLIQSCKGRPDFYHKALEVLNQFQLFNLKPDYFTTTVLLGMAAQSKKLKDVRYLFKKLVEMDQTLPLNPETRRLIHFYLFMAYASNKKITQHRNDFSKIETKLQQFTKLSLIEVLNLEEPRTSADVVLEATYMFNNYTKQLESQEGLGDLKGKDSKVLGWYLTILANYNYTEQLQHLLNLYYPDLAFQSKEDLVNKSTDTTDSNPECSYEREDITKYMVYGPGYNTDMAILDMTFRLKLDQLVDSSFERCQQHFKPLYYKSGFSTVEKDIYLAQHKLGYKQLTKFFVSSINGLGNLDRAVSLLDEMFKIQPIRKFILTQSFPTVLQKVLDSGDVSLRKKLESYFFNPRKDPVLKNQINRQRVFKKTNYRPKGDNKRNQMKIGVEELI